MRYVFFGVAMIAVLVVAAATSRSESEPAADDTDAPGMATSEPATEPLGSEPRKEPFAPHESGPPEGVIRYDQLGPEDKAVADRLASQDAERQQVLDVYARGANEQFEQGVAMMAQQRLGLLELGELGVVGGVTGDTPGVGPDTGEEGTSGGNGFGGGGGRGTGGGGGQGTGGGGGGGQGAGGGGNGQGAGGGS